MKQCFFLFSLIILLFCSFSCDSIINDDPIRYYKYRLSIMDIKNLDSLSTFTGISIVSYAGYETTGSTTSDRIWGANFLSLSTGQKANINFTKEYAFDIDQCDETFIKIVINISNPPIGGRHLKAPTGSAEKTLTAQNIIDDFFADGKFGDTPDGLYYLDCYYSGYGSGTLRLSFLIEGIE